MVKRGSMAQPPQVGRKKRKNIRRVRSVPLRSTPGAELRLPAMPQVRIGWRIVSGLMTLLLGWALYSLWTSPQFTVTEAEIIGLERVSGHEVNTILKVAGVPIFTIDPQALQDRLAEAFPELTGVTIEVGFPASVVVEVTERYPVILWVQSGVEAWVDQNGIAFLPRGPHPDWLVPIYANATPPAEDMDQGQSRLIMPEMVTAILTIAPDVPEGSTLAYHDQHGLGWKDPRGWEVYFGQKPDNMEARLAVYDAIVNYLDERNIRPEIVSVEYLHAPYYRLKTQN
jgi:hypothetical protein